jgi:hypothetical protein
MSKSSAGLAERHWRNLLMDIEARQVVPIVGPELLVLEAAPAKPVTLYDRIGAELVARFGIDEGHLPERYSLFDVTRVFLQNPSNQPDDLNYEAREILSSGKWPIPEPLQKLSAITHFDLFVSATFDGLLEQTLRETRGGRTASAAYSEKSQVEDLPPDYAERCDSTVFQIFGKLNATGDYALTEEKLLEFTHRLQSRDLRPQNLFDVLRSKHLLMIGCSFPGWLARFLLRASKGDQLWTTGARGVIADRQSRNDAEFMMFLERRKMLVYLEGDGVQFVDELHRRWTSQCGKAAESSAASAGATDEGIPAFQPDSVFLSYASEDRLVALRVKEAFDSAGVDVWFDQRALESGDDYRLKIEKNIESCSYFVPLISKHTAGEDRRFFRLEWYKAIDEAKFRPPDFPFIQPILIDDTPLDAPGIPRAFTDRHCRKLDALAALAEDAKKRIRERRLARRTAA